MVFDAALLVVIKEYLIQWVSATNDLYFLRKSRDPLTESNTEIVCRGAAPRTEWVFAIIAYSTSRLYLTPRATGHAACRVEDWHSIEESKEILCLPSWMLHFIFYALVPNRTVLISLSFSLALSWHIHFNMQPILEKCLKIPDLHKTIQHCWFNVIRKLPKQTEKVWRLSSVPTEIPNDESPTVSRITVMVTDGYKRSRKRNNIRIWNRSGETAAVLY